MSDEEKKEQACLERDTVIYIRVAEDVQVGIGRTEDDDIIITMYVSKTDEDGETTWHQMATGGSMGFGFALEDIRGGLRDALEKEEAEEEEDDESCLLN